MLRCVSFALLTAWALTPSHAADPAGDRRPGIQCIYPAAAYFHNNKGGSVLDITKPPFNAKGDGVTDDTAAFIKAYDFVLREQDKVGYAGTAMLLSGKMIPNEEGYPPDGPVKTNDSSFIIYIPNGTYVVSDTIIYSMPDRTPSTKRGMFFKRGELQEVNSGKERLIWIRFIGESREKTIIRLRDRSPGFEAGKAKAVVSYGKSGFNNRKAFNALRNLTIDTGRDNPGAVAVDFTGANKSQICNVTLRANDGHGHCGLLLKRPPVLGWNHDITIEGFDFGLISRCGHASAPVFEFLTLRHIHKAGIMLTEDQDDDGSGQAMLVMRMIRSESRAPAAILEVEGSHLIMLDSELIGEDIQQPAIKQSRGQLFLSNIQVTGYDPKVSLHGKLSPTGKIAQYVSSSLPDQAPIETPLARMPVLEAPTQSWPQGLSEWATPEEFGAKSDGKTDDTTAIQAAFNSGKPYIFLSGSLYHTSAPIRVPASVRGVDGMFRRNPELSFEVTEASPTPVRFADLLSADVKHSAKRPVVLDMCGSQYSNTEAAAGSVVYILNGSYPKASHNKAKIEVRAWAMNNESKGLPVSCDSAKTWVLGLKVERGPTLRASGGAQMEIYGATIGVSPGNPAIQVTDSNLILVANSSAGRWSPESIALETTQSGTTLKTPVGKLPLRQANGSLRMIPLFVTER
jgi:hypothetical protein